MSRFIATKAQRLALKARVGLTGATNTGKTYTALMIAKGLLESEKCYLENGDLDWSKVAVIDTERKRSLFYADTGEFGEFTHIDFQPPYDPNDYIEAVKYAESLGIKVCIIDSLSHAWSGTGGVLEIVNDITEKSKTKNSFAGWGGKSGGTALQNKMIDEIMSCNMHTICTFRQKMEYLIERDETTGRNTIQKMGVKPVQRDDLEYEFDITLKLNNDHSAEVIKNTVFGLGNKAEILEPLNSDFGMNLGNYLSSGISTAEYEKEVKDKLVNEVKEIGTSNPVLFDYFKSKHNGKHLNELNLKELRELLKDFKEMQ